VNVARSVILCSLALFACEPSDLGRACPPPDGTADPTTTGSTDDNEIVFPATVRKDGKCEYFQCVSTQVRQNYCSKECANDRDCPDGFTCATLQPVGPLSQDRFCLLSKTCKPNQPADCPRDTMLCREVQTTTPDQPAYFCDLKK
jgi:hypothetical protein